MEENSHTFRLGWKGVFCEAEPLLSMDGNTPLWISLPIVLVLFLPRLLLSYLRVGPAGMEVRYWPRYRARIPWGAVERLGECLALGPFKRDALYLSGAGTGVLHRETGLRQNLIIPISDFHGWPDGRLREELTRFIPRVVEPAD